jgi:hypothetical protein
MEIRIQWRQNRRRDGQPRNRGPISGRRKTFSAPTASRPRMPLPQFLYPKGTAQDLSHAAKRSENEAEHSPVSRDGGKYAWSYTSIPSYVFIE